MQQREKGTGKVVERRSTAENQFVNPNLCAYHFKTVGLGYATRLKVQIWDGLHDAQDFTQVVF